MPELPEVETARRAAYAAAVRRRIVGVTVTDDPIVFEGVTPRGFAMPSWAGVSGPCGDMESTSGSSSTGGRGCPCTSAWRGASTHRAVPACASFRAATARSPGGRPRSRSSASCSRTAVSSRSPTGAASAESGSGTTRCPTLRSVVSGSTRSTGCPRRGGSGRWPGRARARSRRSCWTSRSRRASEPGSPTKCCTKPGSRPGARCARSPTPSSTGCGSASARSSAWRFALARTAIASRGHGSSIGGGIADLASRGVATPFGARRSRVAPRRGCRPSSAERDRRAPPRESPTHARVG